MKLRLAVMAAVAWMSLPVMASEQIQPPPDEPIEKNEPTRQIGSDFSKVGKNDSQPKSRRIGSPAKPAPASADAPEKISLPPLPEGEFEAAARKELPLTPEQIRFLRRTLDQSQRATAEQPGIPAKPVASRYDVDLSPGVTPPVIRLGQNYITSIVFVDATGERWPFTAYAVGNDGAFDVQEPDKAGNALTAISKTAYGTGNLSVFLQGVSTPVTLTLVSGQKEVDYRADVRIKMRGPNAQAPVVSGDEVTASDPVLLGVLDGLLPNGARELTSSDGDIRAWSYNGKMYLRTRTKLLSPAWMQTRRTPDGTHAYVTREDPVLVVSSQGAERLVKLSGFVWNDPSKNQNVRQVNNAAAPATPAAAAPAATAPVQQQAAR